ncbi:MAG: hypothetical protein MUP09_00500, partial [Thiovulaceae bacterium]|nr:hypothetical protein [Sulfurimonadaceae bacterium]
ERVWHLDEGSDELKIDKAIELTEAFFQSMNVPTRLSEVDVTKDDIDGIVEKLEQHGMTQLGENKDITLEVSRTILEQAL